MSRPKIDDFKVTGNLVADPKNVQTNAGRNLTVFQLAENNRVYDREAGQWKDADPNFFDVAVDADDKRLGHLAENVGNSLHKGDLVSVEGAYTATPYVTSDNDVRMNHRVWANEVAPSLRFATAEMTRNTPAASAEAETNQHMDWAVATPGGQGPEMD